MGKIYNSLLKLSKEEAIGMVQEQSLRYMRAFGTHHLKQPASRVGKPPGRGHPGYNPDLMVMDLAKLRGDPEYRAALGELRLALTMRKFTYHPEAKLPSLGRTQAWSILCVSQLREAIQRFFLLFYCILPRGGRVSADPKVLSPFFS